MRRDESRNSGGLSMANELHDRAWRDESYEPRGAAAAGNGERPAGQDPLAELARLIGHDDPFDAVDRKAARAPRPQWPAAEAQEPADPAAPSWLTRGSQPAPADVDGHAGTADGWPRADAWRQQDEARRQQDDAWRQQEPAWRQQEPAWPRQDEAPRQEEAWRAGRDEPAHQTAAPYQYPEPATPAQWDAYDRGVDQAEPGYGARSYDQPQGGAPTGLQAMGYGQDVPFPAGPGAAAVDPYAADPYAARGYPPGHADAPQGGAYDPGAYYVDDGHMPPHGDDVYDDAPVERRRSGLMIVGAVLGLAVIGIGGAFGYRALSSGPSKPAQPPVIKAETAPTKVVPSTAEGGSNKLIQDRVGDRAPASVPTERIVSREEAPVDVAAARPGAPRVVLPGGVAPQPQANGDGRKVRTVTIRPDQPSGPGPDVTAAAAAAQPAPAAPAARQVAPAPAPSQAAVIPPARPAPQRPAAAAGPVDLAPPATRPAAPFRTAAALAATASAPSGAFVVQLSAQRSEGEAQASFRSLQSKYPGVLGGRSPLIRKKDLGDKGVYYAAQVGPFGSRDDANNFCVNLKAAGGQCMVQKN